MGHSHYCDQGTDSTTVESGFHSQHGQAIILSSHQTATAVLCSINWSRLSNGHAKRFL